MAWPPMVAATFIDFSRPGWEEGREVVAPAPADLREVRAPPRVDPDTSGTRSASSPREVLFAPDSPIILEAVMSLC